MEEDRLGAEAARKLYEEEQAELAREQEEMKKKSKRIESILLSITNMMIGQTSWYKLQTKESLKRLELKWNNLVNKIFKILCTLQLSVPAASHQSSAGVTPDIHHIPPASLHEKMCSISLEVEDRWIGNDMTYASTDSFSRISWLLVFPPLKSVEMVAIPPWDNPLVPRIVLVPEQTATDLFMSDSEDFPWSLAREALPSPDYVPGPEEPEQAPPLP
ncbi:hypothetical protein Tco_0296242 [Tanacetum coccineum]